MSSNKTDQRKRDSNSEAITSLSFQQVSGLKTIYICPKDRSHQVEATQDKDQYHENHILDWMVSQEIEVTCTMMNVT